MALPCLWDKGASLYPCQSIYLCTELLSRLLPPVVPNAQSSGYYQERKSLTLLPLPEVHCCTRVRKTPRGWRAGTSPAHTAVAQVCLALMVPWPLSQGYCWSWQHQAALSCSLVKKTLPCLALCSAFSLCNAPSVVMNIMKYSQPCTFTQGTLD